MFQKSTGIRFTFRKQYDITCGCTSNSAISQLQQDLTLSKSSSKLQVLSAHMAFLLSVEH